MKSSGSCVQPRSSARRARSCSSSRMSKSEGLVDDRHQHRRQQIPARTAWDARTREQRTPTGWPRRRHYPRLGAHRRIPPLRRRRRVFHDELVYLLLHQYAAFNSPVWFNVGCDRLEPNSDAANWHWNPQLGASNSVQPATRPAVLGVLHQLHPGHDGVHPDTGQDRGHALQVGSGTGRICRRYAAPWKSSGGGTAAVRCRS